MRRRRPARRWTSSQPQASDRRLVRPTLRGALLGLEIGTSQGTLPIHEGTSRNMNGRSTTADLKRKLRRLIRSMDFVSRHPALKRAGPEAERLHAPVARGPKVV